MGEWYSSGLLIRRRKAIARSNRVLAAKLESDMKHQYEIEYEDDGVKSEVVKARTLEKAILRWKKANPDKKMYPYRLDKRRIR